MIDKAGSKLSDLSDVPKPDRSIDGYVLKVREGVFEFAADEKSLAEIKSQDIQNETLVDADFASGIEMNKFSGLQEKIDSYVDKVPAGDFAEMMGDINFGDSQLSGVSEIQTSKGSFSLSLMRTDVNNLDMSLKLNALSPVPDASKKYYLSTDTEGNLTWRELTTENVFGGGEHFLFL